MAIKIQRRAPGTGMTVEELLQPSPHSLVSAGFAAPTWPVVTKETTMAELTAVLAQTDPVVAAWLQAQRRSAYAYLDICETRTKTVQKVPVPVTPVLSTEFQYFGQSR